MSVSTETWPSFSSGSTVSIRKAGLLAAGLAVLMYLNTLDCGMVYDDEPAISSNKDLRPHTPWTNLIWDDFWGAPMSSKTSHKSYRPLCVATFRLNYLLHELQPMGYHLVNVFLHGAVCYLYVQLCGVVFSQVWPALIAGLLFAVHPIHTEAVAGIVGRAELLAALFYLLTFLTYKKSLHYRGVSRALSLSVSLSLSVCAMLSKEQGVTSTAVCLVYDFFVIQQLDLWSLIKLSDSHLSHTPKLLRFFKRGLLVSGVTLVAIATRIWIANGAPSQRVINSILNPPLSQDSPYRQLSWLYLVVVNSWLLLCPSKLSADWRFGVVPLINSITDAHNLLTILSAIVIMALLLFGLLGREKHNKIVLVCTVMMIIPFVPASNLFFPVGFVVAERVLYLPSMGFCMLVAYGCWNLLRRARKSNLLKKSLLIFIGCLLLLYSVKTLLRNRDWYSYSTFNKAGVKFNPLNAAMLSNLGIDHAVMKDYSIAEQLYEASMRVAPHYSVGYYNYGKLMKITQRYREAEWPLQKAIELSAVNTADRNIVDSYHLLASVISMNTSRLDEALSVCNEGIILYPDMHQLLTTKCGILVKMNLSHQAIPLCEEALRRNSFSAQAHYHLGLAYLRLSYISQAERSLWNSVRLDSSNKDALYHLATILQASTNRKDLQEAQKLWLQLINLEPNNLEAMLNLAQVFADVYSFDQSLTVLQWLLEQQPNHAEALYRAGVILHHTKRYSEATRTLSKLLQLHHGYRNAQSLLSAAEKMSIKTADVSL